METISSRNNDLQGTYLVFFDLDRTLISEISGNAMVRGAYEKGLLPMADIANAFYLYLLYKLGLRDPLRVIVDMVGWVKGKDEIMMRELCLDIYRKVLFPSLYNEALKEIKIHRENNARLVLLSSGLDTICSRVTESLAFDDMICSSLEVKDGYFTGKPVGRLCFGDEKLKRMTGYCTEHSINLSESWYYGDAISDLPVLESVGNPVCVNPDRRLKKEALKRGWKIVQWRH
jgi:HAD superfamily hydrolase (TIGR01490 family)